MANKLYLIRGIPGCGKSTLAKQIKKIDTIHLEADQYFVVNGEYNFDGMKIGAAHEWCQRETDSGLFYKQDVIVSNTFTTIKELKPYFLIAKKYGIVPTVITCQTVFGNVHGVPEEVLENMKKRFCYDISSLFELLKE